MQSRSNHKIARLLKRAQMLSRQRMKSQKRLAVPTQYDAVPNPRPSKRNKILRNAVALVITLVVLLLLFQSSGSSIPAINTQQPLKTENRWRIPSKKLKPPVVYTYEVVNRFPHDPSAFTQGFQFERLCGDENAERRCLDVFLESTGLYGESSVRRSIVESGEIVNMTSLDSKFFGEGSTRFGEHVYQLTWRTPSVFVYNENLTEIDVRYTPLKDGWGLTTDEEYLIMTDSGSVLYWIDPKTFQLHRQKTVTDGGREVQDLNELEYIDGMVWSNVWQKDCVAIIDPEDGLVHGWVLFHGLKKEAAKETQTPTWKMDVLNGIAYDAENDRLFVTGKWWPLVFEIKVTPKESPSEKDLERIRRLCIP